MANCNPYDQIVKEMEGVEESVKKMMAMPNPPPRRYIKGKIGLVEDAIILIPDNEEELIRSWQDRVAKLKKTLETVIFAQPPSKPKPPPLPASNEEQSNNLQLIDMGEEEEAQNDPFYDMKKRVFGENYFKVSFAFLDFLYFC